MEKVVPLLYLNTVLIYKLKKKSCQNGSGDIMSNKDIYILAILQYLTLKIFIKQL